MSSFGGASAFFDSGTCRHAAAMTKAASAGDEFELPATGVDLEKLERSLLVQALRRSNGHQTRAGALLGLNRDQIRYRIEKFGLAKVE